MRSLCRGLSLHLLYAFLKLSAAVLVALEEVEACAARREKHHIAFGGEGGAFVYSLLHASGVDHGGHFAVEKCVKFGVVYTQAYYCFHLFLQITSISCFWNPKEDILIDFLFVSLFS